MTAGDFPRTVLLTRWPPHGRYAGGEVLRKITARLPRERLRWAYFGGPVCEASGELPEHRAFLPRKLHWRLRRFALEYYYECVAQAGWIARRIRRWTAGFRPELIWVGSDLAGVSFGLRLQRMTRFPLHVTVYDAYETSRMDDQPPRLAYPHYLRTAHRLMARAVSVDAVSRELIEHVRCAYPVADDARTLAFPASVSIDGLSAPLPDAERLWAGTTRRIAFCGSYRTTPRQWEDFLGLLSRLPYAFRIAVFASPEYFYRASCPANVNLDFQPYAPTEKDVIEAFRRGGFHAAYLGVYRDAHRRLFATTSLSSKLTTYSAAGLPIIADAPETSPAWRLIGAYGAGILVGPDSDASLGALRRLFGSPQDWDRMARGAVALCRAEFDLDRNIERFKALLCESAGGGER